MTVKSDTLRRLQADPPARLLTHSEVAAERAANERRMVRILELAAGQ